MDSCLRRNDDLGQERRCGGGNDGAEVRPESLPISVILAKYALDPIGGGDPSFSLRTKPGMDSCLRRNDDLGQERRCEVGNPSSRFIGSLFGLTLAHVAALALCPGLA